MAHLVIPDNPEGYMTKKASISNIAGESIPLMFGVLPRDNLHVFPKHRGSDWGSDFTMVVNPALCLMGLPIFPGVS